MLQYIMLQKFLYKWTGEQYSFIYICHDAVNRLQ